MANPLGKAKLKVALKELDCTTEYDAWAKAEPLDDDGARRIDQLADEYDGIPRLRALGGYLLLDAGDGETICVFQDARGTRRELIGQILASMPKEGQEGEQDAGDDSEEENYPRGEPDYAGDDAPIRVQEPRRPSKRSLW